MEYEFKQGLTGEREARLSMGHEAFGRLLTEELGRPERVSELLETLMRTDGLAERRIGLGEWTLTLELGEILLSHNALGIAEEQELDPEVELYDQESEACCGLEDLCQLLESWQQFLGR
ncbi:hypothetical protein FCL40_14105 [Ferrimonas sediminicola]|uniref:Uncharacterized protein n=1 Tax=Ferrimonas sediminicola TaxID=2569538 RepID=A0A4U1BAZ2_9GAMM|nr:YacL family protein [Ferrimonas sediminicola]TKB48054.1 hypothetical protein FCL40_14105 [Ferrimonas sediminicola]